MSNKVFIDTKGKTPDQVASEAINTLAIEQQGFKILSPIITSEMAKENPEACIEILRKAYENSN